MDRDTIYRARREMDTIAFSQENDFERLMGRVMFFMLASAMLFVYQHNTRTLAFSPNKTIIEGHTDGVSMRMSATRSTGVYLGVQSAPVPRREHTVSEADRGWNGTIEIVANKLAEGSN